MVDVLVVDDERRPGESFAKLIQAKTRLSTTFTDDPEEAVRIVRQNHIKVVVLDQKMPKMSGTELFVRLRESDPHLRAILFSGQAQLEDYSTAAHEGFLELVDKSDLARLPKLVSDHYAHYLAEVANNTYRSAELLKVIRTGFSFRGSKVTFDLMEVKDAPGVDQTIALENEFRTFVQLAAGQTKQSTYTETRELEIVVEYERQVKATLGAQTDAKTSASTPIKFELSSQLKSAIESSLKEKYNVRARATAQREISDTYVVPAETPGVSPYVTSRQLQRAPVYERKRVLVRTTCDCCGCQQYDSFNVLIPTGDFRTRQIDFMSDNTSRTIVTG